MSIAATVVTIGAVGLALGLYGYIRVRLRVSNPSIALMFGISGTTTGGKLTTRILHYESTIALLTLAFLSKIVFESYFFYKVFELAAAISFLACSIIILQSFRREAAVRNMG